MGYEYLSKSLINLDKVNNLFERDGGIMMKLSAIENNYNKLNSIQKINNYIFYLLLFNFIRKIKKKQLYFNEYLR